MKKLALALAILCTSSLLAQKTDTVVKQVNDRRTSGSFSQLIITVELPAVKNADVAASRVLVASAVDDSGKSLVESESGEPQLETNAPAMYGGDKTPSPASVSVTLKNPARSAMAVKQLSGQIELYMPSKDPNSVAEIAKFTSQAGKTLSHKALKANGVEIAAISAAQLDAEKKRLGEAKRTELKAGGYDEETLTSLVSSFLEYLLKFEESDIVLRIKDPNKRIQEISFVDGAGETKRASMRDDEGYTVLSTWGEKPQPDWKLRISMKTQKNIVRYPFVLTNVALP